MPATMMHLYAGKLDQPNGDLSYYLGCILPDCVDADRTVKDHLHFRDVPAEERLIHLIRFGKQLDLSRSFNRGALLHFYLDYLWDNGPQKVHRMNYNGESWFRDYRKELAAAGNETYRRMPWANALWNKIRTATPNDYDNSLELPEQDILHFLDFNYHWHTENELSPARIFHAELVDRFTARSVKAFHSFLHDFFPNLSSLSERRISP